MTSSKTAKNIDICICTFQRDHLIKTLVSVNEIESVIGYNIAIIVVDNDWEPSAKTEVENFAKSSTFPVKYLHCPAGNISIARNGCLNASTAEFLAFIDDDETVKKNWLQSLIRHIEIENADVVLGPVIAHYKNNAAGWLKHADFHSTYPVWSDGKIKSGYTCNVLMRMTSPSITGRQFNLERGRTGGEDTEFFSNVFKAGGHISYEKDAIVEEIVPDNRASLNWLLNRKFRFGQTHGKLLLKNLSPMGKIKQTLIALSKVIYCLIFAILRVFNKPACYKNLLRGTLHVGTMSGLLNFSELTLYGKPAPAKE